MKKLFLLPLLLFCSGRAFGQTNIPPCTPVSGTPCTDYFGVANYANSPLPTGAISAITVVNGGSGYTTPTVTIVDPTGTGATAATATVVGGVITAINGGLGGSGYIAPQVVVLDPSANASGATFSITLASMTGGMPKFVPTDLLPDLKAAIANPDTTTFSGSDYYVIGLQQYTTVMHSSLPPTTVRGYCQLNNPVAQGVCTPSYLGPVIVATKNRPVRVLFKNMLPTGTGGNLFIPVDTTYMGAAYAQNRATLHLHGGITPWISDGTPHQWTVPMGETSMPGRGPSTQFVPDMWFDVSGNIIASCAGQSTCVVAGATNDPGQGAMTFYWTNAQGGRLMFYHDHAYGITRLNVYAGEAAGYLLLDPAEENNLAAATVPGTITGTAADLTHLIPLVIQDKTFVPSAAQLAAEDPTWIWGSGATSGINGNGDLWFPHVYMTNQNPADPGGANGFGRWDYGPWFFPPQTSLTAANPPTAVTVPCTSVAFPNQVVNCPITPNPSGTPEGFMDTPVVNGKAYPVMHVAPAAYRFKILAAGNDRSWNLSWFLADPTGKDVPMLPAVPPAAGTPLPLCSSINTVTNPNLVMGIPAAMLGASGPLNGTGLPANCWPNYGPSAGIPAAQTMWAADGRSGGAPDPRNAGPAWIQIGSEGGLLPAPVVIPPTPVNYELNTRSITITNVAVHGLWVGPAERADVIVDFSAFAGKTLILYNDAPTPAPAFDSRLDLFTGDADQTSIGGPPTTQPGYGPNTRTVMQVIVDQTAPNTTPFNLTTLAAALPGVFAGTQQVPIVPEPTYPAGSGGNSSTSSYSAIHDNSLTFYAPGATTATTINDGQKAIQELFTLDYGRMNATLGTELPLTSFTTQTTIPLGYIDPVTEIVKQGDTQLWKITHNGVDTHFVHFHLFNVQVINRMGWDGTIRPPDANELGWKDTVRMNPLEDILVALQPITPPTPWPLPNSIRYEDVTAPANTSAQFTNVDPFTNNPATTLNSLTNYGWEYVWHCHILGHEENDMMRAIIFQVPPPAPSNLAAVMDAITPGQVDLKWTDNSANETGFNLQRSTDPTFATGTTTILVAPSLPTNAAGEGISWGGLISYNDTPAGAGPFYYRVQAVDDAFKPTFEQPYNATPALLSGWSNTSSVGGTSAFASVAPTTLTFGNVTWPATLSKTVTLSNSSSATALTFGPISFTGTNASAFTETDTCGGTVAINSSCVLTVTFGPTAAGPQSATMTIPTGDPLNPTLTVSLSGGGSAILVITASGASMKYGGAVPVITPSYAGFVGTDTPANLTTQPTCSTTALSNSPVGTYPATCTGAVDSNYTITYVAGTVSVTPASLTIWGPDVSMVVGGPIPPLTPAYTGFVAGDTATTLTLLPNVAPTCTTTATVTSPTGSYPVSCSGAVDPNYTISYVDGTLKITQGTLTITAPTVAMTYGGPMPTLTPTYNPGVPVPPLTAPTCTTTATITSPVGTYPVTCSGAIDPNYTIAYASGTLTVTPAALTISAPSPTVTYGSPIPALTPAYTGFVAGDSAATLTKTPNVAPTCTTAATNTSPVGNYTVTCSGAVDSNYTISYVAGTLTVAAAPLTITASSATVSYWGAVPAVTPTFGGFVNGETAAALTTQPTCSTNYAQGSSVAGNPYTTSCSGATASNYSIIYVAGKVTVLAVPLAITASNGTMVYGGTPPAITPSYVGFVGGETPATLTVAPNAPPVCSPNVTNTSNAGTYASTCAGAVDTNYAITYVSGTVAVTPAPAIITASSPSMIYGGPVPAIIPSFSGFVNGQNNSVLTTQPTCSTAATSASNVGKYPSTCAGAVALNYSFSYAPGTVTIAKASTATAITANTPNPAILGQIVTVSFQAAPQFTGTPTGSVKVTASTGETCSTVLGGGAGSCTIIFFTGGSRNLTAAYPGDTNFTGSSSAPVTQVISSVSLSTTSLLFGDQVVGTRSAPQTVTVSNVGISTINITNIQWSTNFSDSSNCLGRLTPGSSCRINVRFVPTTTGVLTGTLTITDSDPTSPQIVGLKGTGVIPAIAVAPGSLALTSTVGVTSAAQQVTVTNTGTAAATINSVRLNGANANQFAQNSNCVGALAVGASCTINVTFTPTGIGTGTDTANLNVNVAAPATSQTVALTGTVIYPVNTVAPTTLLFGTQGVNTTSAPQTATVTNTGTAPLTLTGISVTGGNANQFAQTNTCGAFPATIAAGGSCTVSVTFRPTSRGAKSSTLRVAASAPATTQTVALTGTGQ